MSWLSRLYHTYEQVKNNADAQLHYALMPYYHVKQNVQIIVTINDKGEFVKARLARDGNGKLKSQVTTIPATNDSATRTSSPVAHPLADKLQYVAKDFFAKSNNKKDVFDLYENTLTAWCQSPFSHAKAQAVLAYVKKGTVTQDLINAGIIIADEKGNIVYPENASDYPDSILSLLVKNGGTFDQGSAFVAWEVITADMAQGDITTWKDESLFTAWQDYYASFDSKEGFCHITGEHKALASKHPNRVLKSASSAKLISANDMSGFTFLGRFTDDDKSIAKQGYQAANVSAAVSEKAHAALGWLLRRQGKEDAGQAIVAWSVSGSPLIQPTQEFKLPIASNNDSETLDSLNPWEDEVLDIDDFEHSFEQHLKQPQSTDDALSDKNTKSTSMTTPPIHHQNDIGLAFSKKLQKAMAGYQQSFNAHEQISIISLEAATLGRMAVTYYHEALPKDYLQALTNWQADFAWYAFYTTDDSKEKKLTIQASTPKVIAESAYGKRLSDGNKKQVVSQVLPVIVEGRHLNVPYHLVDLCIKRACNPLAVEHWEWEQILLTACGLYRGYFSRLSNNNKRSYTMSLQEDYTSRDYLYGRLLAIAEDIEGLALYVAGEKRTTTAQRYMQQFANRPFSTWRNIELALDPYIKRLNNNRSDYLFNKQTLLGDVMSKFDISDFNDDSPLTGEFLLGYHCQKMAFYLTKQAKKIDNSSNTEQQANA